MTSQNDLEKKIQELEERVKTLEDQLADNIEEKELMDAFYLKAKELVLKNNKSSAIFLQTKLLIDHPRAVKLVDRLKKEGVVDPTSF